MATCDFFIEHTYSDGIPFWDTGAPELHRLGNYQDMKSDPFNEYEPVDSSAAAIGAQGILLHSVYHRPNGWDNIPGGRHIPCGESSMWGDYHITELCLTAQRLLVGDHYTFFSGLSG